MFFIVRLPYSQYFVCGDRSINYFHTSVYGTESYCCLIIHNSGKIIKKTPNGFPSFISNANTPAQTPQTPASESAPSGGLFLLGANTCPSSSGHKNRSRCSCFSPITWDGQQAALTPFTVSGLFAVLYIVLSEQCHPAYPSTPPGPSLSCLL